MEEMDLLGTFESTWMGGTSTMPVGDWIRDNEQANVELSLYPFSSISPGDAAGKSNKRRGSPPDDVGVANGRDGKRIKSPDIGGVSGPIMLSDVRQLQRSNECHEQDTQTLLFSCSPTESAPLHSLLDPSGSRQNVQQISSFKLDRAKHKIFLSHSGAQKNFVEQLCVDLEARGYLFPFFDQRHHSLPKGKDFVPLIKEATQLCHVAVMVLSKEFLCSKWPMIELAEFHAAQQAGNKQLNMFPLFYELSIDELDDRSVEDLWMPVWIQHASTDERIDVTKWSAAVRALRRANGEVFGKNTMSKVAYRKDVVRSIVRLSPLDLLYCSSRGRVGYDRMCGTVSSRFVEDTWVGAPVLGLYGTTGIGKSTLSKALCDYFSGKFFGRVCHVELGERSRMKRQKSILKMLCGFENDMLDRITDVGQGLELMRQCMKREPVFLTIDNVTNDESSWNEAHEYLMVGFHPQSRIMISSRSKCNIQDLLPGVEFCMSMPSLSVREAGEIFLRSAAPTKSIFNLMDEERRIIGLCIQQCLFESDQDESLCEPDNNEKRFLSDRQLWDIGGKSYHPLALSALGDFFRRYISNTDMLCWKDHIGKSEDTLKDLWKSSNRIRSIISLQFSSLHPSEQLLFLDIALYTDHWWFWRDSYRGDGYFGCFVEWLSEWHDEAIPVMKRRLQDLRRSGMIDYDEDFEDHFYVRVHGLYKEFAEWYVTQHTVKGLKNAWCVFQSSGASLKCDPPASELVRLRVSGLNRANTRLVASKAMQELHNLEVLQLHSCTNVTELNLEGLGSLRHLELVKLTKLVTVTLIGRSSTDENVGIYESLRCVFLEDLDALTHGPDVRSCTSLHWFRIRRCPKLTNLEGIECPHLEELYLEVVVPHQLARLPNVESLNSLIYFFLRCDGYVDMSDVVKSLDERILRDPEWPLFRALEDFLLYLREGGENIPPSDGLTNIWWHKNKLTGHEELECWDSKYREYFWTSDLVH